MATPALYTKIRALAYLVAALQSFELETCPCCELPMQWCFGLGVNNETDSIPFSFRSSTYFPLSFSLSLSLLFFFCFSVPIPNEIRNTIRIRAPPYYSYEIHPDSRTLTPTCTHLPSIPCSSISEAAVVFYMLPAFRFSTHTHSTNA